MHVKLNGTQFEIPTGYRPLPWSIAKEGQLVWVVGTDAGRPRAYGPFHVHCLEPRTLVNAKGRTFRSGCDELLVPMEEVQYKHDCAACTFLGRSSEGHDLYYCTQGGTFPTVIARRSSDGSDYVSGVVFAEHHKSIGEGVALSKALGFKLD